MTKYEHTSVVLHFDKKTFAVTRSDTLQGLAAKSAESMRELGNEGWELVAVLPYSRGGMFVAGEAGTDAAIGFFKRAKA
ncbi:MAG: hypothetical protein ABIZ49_04615 [Opitutaceae bacterium]